MLAGGGAIHPGVCAPRLECTDQIKGADNSDADNHQKEIARSGRTAERRKSDEYADDQKRINAQICDCRDEPLMVRAYIEYEFRNSESYRSAIRESDLGMPAGRTLTQRHVG
jgi:hypothetical protein